MRLQIIYDMYNYLALVNLQELRCHKLSKTKSKRVRVDLGVMAVKVYNTFTRATELEPRYWIQFSVILRTLRLGCIMCQLRKYHK